MKVQQSEILVKTQGQGLMEFTSEAHSLVPEEASGLAHFFIQHTSASLLIQENADPTARADLQEFISRLAPESQPWHQHILEGPDDSPSHMRSAVTQSSLSVPLRDGKLVLGTWQGLYVWEHRRVPHQRKVFVTLMLENT